MSLMRLRALLGLASPPPWWVNDGHMVANFGQDEDGSEYHVGTPNAMAAESSDDATLIAELRNHAGALLDVVDAARWLRGRHWEGDAGCDACRQVWPCETRRSLDAALARLDGEDTG